MHKAFRLLPLLAPLLIGAGCSKGPADTAAPVAQITPQPIMFFDITQAKLYGSGCNFVAADGGMGAVVLAQAERAIIKLDGNLVTLAADKASKAMPQGSWSHYAGTGNAGKAYALTLTRIEDGKAVHNGVIDLFSGQVTITDAQGQSVYAAKGNVQCKPM